MGNPLTNIRSLEDARPALAALKELAAERASDAVAASRPVREAAAGRLASEAPKAKRLLEDVKRRLPERKGGA